MSKQENFDTREMETSQPTQTEKNDEKEETGIEVKLSTKKRIAKIISDTYRRYISLILKKGMKLFTPKCLTRIIHAVSILAFMGICCFTIYTVLCSFVLTCQKPAIMKTMDGGADDEVNLQSLAGTHTGRMKAKNNETEAVLDYRLNCSRAGSPSNRSLLRCTFLQVGCTDVKLNGTDGDEECLMEDIGFDFALDRDGNFYTNDSDLFDPVRLAVILYSKHLKAPGMDGKIRDRNVEKRNSSHALVSYDGVTLEVMEVPEHMLKKSNEKRKRRSTFFKSENYHDFNGERNRRSSSSGPILQGAFAESFKRVWGGGPFLRIPTLFSKSGSESGAKYDIRATNFEILLSTLPDIHVSALSKASDSCEVNLKADFSQNGQCSKVIQSRVKLYLDARNLCFFGWCLARFRKDEYVSLDFTPLLQVSTILRPQKNKLQYSFELKSFIVGTDSDIDTGSDIGGIHVNINVGRALGLVFFETVGLLPGSFLYRYFETMAKNLYNDYKAKVPSIIDGNVASLLRRNLPRSGQIDIPNALSGPLQTSISSCNDVNLLTIQLSQIGGQLQYMPPPFKPNKIACSGSGRILTVDDRCMDDDGIGGSDDSIEIYCYRGAKRFCLSHELCPWRLHRSDSCAAMFELATCSPGGLNGVSMARTWGVRSSCHVRCSGWYIFRQCLMTCTCSGSTYGTVNCNRGSVSVGPKYIHPSNPVVNRRWRKGW